MVLIIAKISGVMSCGVMLCLSPSNAMQTAEKMKPNPCADQSRTKLVKCDGHIRQGIDTITGEVH